MPFRNRDWEDFQRDCDAFPAYTDYIYGIDTRPEVANEPGLHPQICKSPPPTPPQRKYGITQTQHLAVYNPARDANRASPSTTSRLGQQDHYDCEASQHVSREFLQLLPNPSPISRVRRESHLQYFHPTPTPAPRTLPTPHPPVALLRPGELAADHLYSFIPQQERMVANSNIAQAWSILNGDALPSQKAEAMGFLERISRMTAAKRQEHEDYLGPEAQELVARRETGLQEDEPSAQQHYDRFADSEARQAGPGTEPGAYGETKLLPNAYAIRDVSQLPAYVHARLPQLWTCTEIVALQTPPVDEIQLRLHQQARQFLVAFTESVPPKGRPWVSLVMDEMLKLRRQGEDPMLVLLTMPSVESVYELGLEAFRDG